MRLAVEAVDVTVSLLFQPVIVPPTKVTRRHAHADVAWDAQGDLACPGLDVYMCRKLPLASKVKGVCPQSTVERQLTQIGVLPSSSKSILAAPLRTCKD